MRGNYLSPGSQVQPGIPAVFDNPQQPFAFPSPKPDWHHTGRRLALAQWLVSRENPLTARVFVNRVWQFHFGEGIVRSVGDFGLQGSAPTHQGEFALPQNPFNFKGLGQHGGLCQEFLL